MNGWTWVRGEASNTTRAKGILLKALEEDGWPRKQGECQKLRVLATLG